jgi:H+/Cl- antiporter ClcA
VEILAEIVMWILQFLAELLVQIVGEAIAELLGHGLLEPFRRPKPVHPWLAAIGYAVYGAVAGALSLWLFPALFIKAHWLRAANLVLTPIIAGLVMSRMGSWRRRRDKDLIRLDTFAYGAFFALSMAIVRFAWGQ